MKFNPRILILGEQVLKRIWVEIVLFNMVLESRTEGLAQHFLSSITLLLEANFIPFFRLQWAQLKKKQAVKKFQSLGTWAQTIRAYQRMIRGPQGGIEENNAAGK